MTSDDRPLAHPGRERQAKELFPFAAMSPEEYAARHAHLLGCFSLHLYRYRDPALGAWVRRVREILATEGEVERCQERFLTPDELATVRKQQTEGF